MVVCHHNGVIMVVWRFFFIMSSTYRCWTCCFHFGDASGSSFSQQFLNWCTKIAKLHIAMNSNFVQMTILFISRSERMDISKLKFHTLFSIEFFWFKTYLNQYIKITQVWWHHCRIPHAACIVMAAGFWPTSIETSSKLRWIYDRTRAVTMMADFTILSQDWCWTQFCYSKFYKSSSTSVFGW